MPLNRETKDLLTFAEGFSVEPLVRTPVDKETEDLLAFAESIESPAIEPTAAQRGQEWAAEAEEARLAHARKELGESVLPGVKAYAIEAGAGIVSPVARLLGKGEYADRMIRFSNAIEQVAREREKGGIIPDILQRGARGAAVSLTSMAAAGMAAGPYGAIAAAAGQETNRAITEGKDAGLRGLKLAEYAISQGVWEGIPATVMQRAGLGGVESVFSKRAVSTGLREGFKRMGTMAGQELIEEIPTELIHNVVASAFDVDPKATTWESWKQTVADTTVQTLITVGFAGAPDVARSVKAGKVAQTTEEIEAYARENKIPSRKIWRKWGLAPEVGGSRKQRKAFVREVHGQLEAPPAEVEPEAVVPPTVPEGLEAAIPAPTAAIGAAVAPEVSEVAVEPEAVTEAPGAVEVPAVEPGVTPPMEVETPVIDARIQKLAEDAGAPELDPTRPVLEDQTTALNKAEGAKIREMLDAPALGEEAVQTWDAVMERVAVDKADERALDMATEVMRTRQQITSYEYGAMVMKVGKLLNDLEAAQVRQGEAAEAGKKFSHDKASVQIDTITGQLDLLTEASRHSRREIARALSIGQMRLSRENFDVVHIIQRMQGAKGLKGKLAKEELADAARHAKRHVDLVKQVTKLEEENRLKDEKSEEALAGKVMETNKPRGKIGKTIREKARAEREDIKDRIRRMGLRVNDITGVSVEGTYLIGRLGITYIKEGVGTLVEVVERLRTDLPDLNLTDQDVYQALIARSPREKARAKSKNAKRVAQLVSMARMHVELEGLADGVDLAVKRKRATVPKEVKALRKKLAEARSEFYASDIEAARVERAIETVNRLQDQLENGLTRLKESPREIPPELANLHEQARQLRMEIGVDAKLAEAQETKKQISEGTYVPPPPRIKKPVNRELERKQIELERERREIRQMIVDSAPWTAKRVLAEVAYSAKAVAATADISFTLRQNAWQIFTHPTLGAKAFIPALKSFFSEYSADQINNSLLHSENSFLYEQSGLAIQDASSHDAQQRSEVYRGQVIERAKILGKQNPFGWIMSASARHAVTIGNLMRTSAFDHFMSKNPNATQEEMRAMADYINISTGIGDLGRFGAIGEGLQVVFFSPKFAVSRVQTPWALAKHWKLPRVRKQIARDMAGFISTGGMILTLAMLAGADMELFDPDDPDWGKIRKDNMRIDIWGGFQQPARVIARIARMPFADVDFDPLDILGRFAAFKLAPAITIPVELVRGKTAVGEEITKLETIGQSFVPLVLRDIGEAWKEEGLAAGLTAGALAAFGVGVSTYPDSETARRGKIKKLKQAKKYGEAERLRLEWNRENPEDRIRTVK